MNRPETQMSDSVEQQVIEIIAEQAIVEPSEVSRETTLADLNIDSLGVVEAVFAIEERFDISVPFNSNNPEESEFDISTVGSMITAVERLVAGKLA